MMGEVPTPGSVHRDSAAKFLLPSALGLAGRAEPGPDIPAGQWERDAHMLSIGRVFMGLWGSRGSWDAGGAWEKPVR